jgi:sugar lactone lactonase YvrE
VGFESERWTLVDAEMRNLYGRECLSGAAYLNDVEFENGVIEVDVAVDGARSYPGIIFRLQSEKSYERIYIRPHRAGLYPDAIQYTPVFNGVAGWQLYNGEGLTAPAEIPVEEWIHLRLEVLGSQARLFLNGGAEPSLEITGLKHGVGRGAIGLLGPKNSTACFSNFAYRSTDDLDFPDEPAAVEPSVGTITEWGISQIYPARAANREVYPHFYAVFFAGWQNVTAEPSGLVDIARYLERGEEPNIVLARTIFRSDGKQTIKMSFGYSDEIDVFFNGKKVFAGGSSYRYRDPSFLGVVGLFDHVYLTAEKGLNEILVMVTETFGGWGLMARTDPALEPPVREHQRLTAVWETPKEFLTPESVLYDPERDVLYVSNFDARYGQTPEHTGYISKLSLDGEIEELKWVSDLNAPTGMGIYEDRLYVTERGFLTEIELNEGEIVQRYPISDSDFLNDLAIDAEGTVYMTDTRPSSHVDSRIYRFKDGVVNVWLDSDEIVRANGLFIDGDELLVGNTGDGTLKAVNLKDKRVRNIACLGAGVVDGIRVDNDGNYLVSHWEGQTYVVSRSGDVVEVLDTLGDGVNSADFEYVREGNLLIIPTFLDNRVMAYRLEEG